MEFPKETREDFLMRGKNGIETCVALGEFGDPFRGRRFMEVEKVKWLFQQLNEQGIRYALAGGLAHAQHSIPRTTQDIDILVLREDAGKVYNLLSRYYLRGTAQVRFYDIEGTKLDVLVASLRYQRAAVTNAVDSTFEGVPIKVLSPRDFVLMKLLAAFECDDPLKGERDRLDAAEVLRDRKDAITKEDIAYIAERLRELCFTQEELEVCQQRINWLNETLDLLGMSDRKYPVNDQ